MTKKSLFVALLGLGVCSLASASDWITADFEDVDLGTGEYYNGSDSAGQFVSHSVSFLNNYSTLYGSWDGFAASKVEDSTTLNWQYQYSAFPGFGAGGSGQYGVAYFSDWAPVPPTIILPDQTTVKSMQVTNTTYAALSMLEGYSPANKFGGPDGTDPDWLLLTINGYDSQDGFTRSAEFYLADYRGENDFVIDQWTEVNLEQLGPVKSLQFVITGSDTSSNGLNTPSYVAIDELTFQAVPEPMTLLTITTGLGIMIRRKRQ